MAHEQPGILAPLPAFSRHLFFELNHRDLAPEYLVSLAHEVDGESVVIGLGASLTKAVDADIPGLLTFPGISGPGVDLPSTPSALWCWLRGNNPGELFHGSRALENLLAPAFSLIQNIELFRYGNGRDLTGYEDGTENPKGQSAREAAIITAADHPLAGSSFVAVQQWIHDFDHFEAMTAPQRDDVIGRRQEDNAELKEAPPSAHVQRTAQETFEPPAFMLRRSMPWTEGERGGLMFVAFGHSFYAFDAALRRMAGLEDGLVDALFEFSRPLSGAYFWCPPVSEGRLDLSVLAL